MPRLVHTVAHVEADYLRHRAAHGSSDGGAYFDRLPKLADGFVRVFAAHETRAGDRGACCRGCTRRIPAGERAIEFTFEPTLGGYRRTAWLHLDPCLPEHEREPAYARERAVR